MNIRELRGSATGGRQLIRGTYRGTMPKLKTHKGAAKRFKKTATGKVKRGHSGLRHMLTSKAHKRKRKLGTVHAGKRRRHPQSKADDSVSVS